MKKLFSVLLAIALLFSVIPMTAVTFPKFKKEVG